MNNPGWSWIADYRFKPFDIDDRVLNPQCKLYVVNAMLFKATHNQ